MRCGNCGMEIPDGSRFCGDCGTAVAPSSPEQYAKYYGRDPYRLRINALCLFGSMLAVVSLFLPWAMFEDASGQGTSIGAFDFDEPLPDRTDIPDGYRYSVALFMIGTLLSFVTPLGGIPLTIGALGYISVSLTSVDMRDSLIPWLGSVVAMLAAGIVLASFIEPTGKGFDREGENRLVAKLLTWSVYRGSPNPCAEE